MLSAPIFILKHQAKVLSRKERIPLHEALDRIARREGFRAWSLLSAEADPSAATTVASLLHPGELVLLGSRPGQGKTLLSLELALRTLQQGNAAAFFTLDLTRSDIAERLEMLGEDVAAYGKRFLVDDSNDICAGHIIATLADAPAKTLVIVDYLQLLDQRRSNPELTDQVRALRAFARVRQLIVVCISQIDRRYDPNERAVPDITDVRLPNPVDLGLFDRTCFLSKGKLQVAATA